MMRTMHRTEERMRRAGEGLRRTRPIGTALLALALALAAGAALAVTTSTVVKVRDGDSLVVRSAGRDLEIRLAYIDAPEFDQAHGRQAGAVLRALVGGRRVRARPDRRRRAPAHRGARPSRQSRRERGDGPARLRVGAAGVPAPARARPAGGPGAGRKARPVGESRSRPTLDLAQGPGKETRERDQAGRHRRPPKPAVPSSAAPRRAVRGQALLQPDDQLRGGARIPAAVRAAPPRPRQGRDPVREALPPVAVPRRRPLRGMDPASDDASFGPIRTRGRRSSAAGSRPEAPSSPRYGARRATTRRSARSGLRGRSGGSPTGAPSPDRPRSPPPADTRSRPNPCIPRRRCAGAATRS